MRDGRQRFIIVRGCPLTVPADVRDDELSISVLKNVRGSSGTGEIVSNFIVVREAEGSKTQHHRSSQILRFDLLGVRIPTGRRKKAHSKAEQTELGRLSRGGFCGLYGHGGKQIKPLTLSGCLAENAVRIVHAFPFVFHTPFSTPIFCPAIDCRSNWKRAH